MAVAACERLAKPQKETPFPFKPIEPEKLRWGKDELLAGIPTYSIKTLCNRVEGLDPTLLGVGSHGVVFRVGEATIKIISEYEWEEKLTEFFQAHGAQGVKEFLEDRTKKKKARYDHFCLGHIAGHAAGAKLTPLIDAPFCIWARFNRQDGCYVAVGYSLPYIDGENVKICHYPHLIEAGRNLVEDHRIYVGNPGGKYNESKNGVITETGRGKFIDVQLIPRGEYIDHRIGNYRRSTQAEENIQASK